MAEWSAVAAHIAEVTGQPFELKSTEWVGGGCINDAVLLGNGERNWFVKFNDSSRLDMFEAEAAGLMRWLQPTPFEYPGRFAAGRTAPAVIW